jgi:hypothetical protein
MSNSDLKSEECKGKIKVKLFFIRHGFSNANQMKASGTWGRFRKNFIIDPPLTSDSIDEIIRERKNIKNIIKTPDIVFSSVLLRAQQTAHYLFPNKVVHVAPWIKEIKPGRDNTPNTPMIQRMKIQDPRLKKITRKHNGVHEPIYTGFVWKSKQWLPGALKSDYNFFMQNWLPTHIRDIILTKKNKNGTPVPTELSIAVIGHSAFMRKFIAKTKDKPNNVGIIQLQYCYSYENLQLEPFKLYTPLTTLQPTNCDPKTGECDKDRYKDRIRVIFRGFPQHSKNKNNIYK